MKKIMKLFVLLIVLTVLAGCGGAAVAPTVAVETAVPEPAEEVVETAVPEPVEEAVEEPTATPAPTDEPEPTAEATAGPTKEPMAVWPNPTATVDASIPTAPQAPEGSVVQPPYIENSCGPDQIPSDYPCPDDAGAWEERIQVPPGFQVKYYAHFDINEQGAPTSITFGPDGLLYVALQNLTGGNGAIYRVDEEGNVKPHAGGLNTPTGITFHPITGELYVSHITSAENEGGESAVSIVNHGRIIEGLPCCYAFMHFAHGIIFDEDGNGYVGVGARADHGEVLGTNEQDELQDNEAVILKFSPDGSEVEVYARGLRNPYGIAWDAEGNIWATDNAPDFGPPEELHKVVPGAEHGYPWYDCDVCFSPPEGVEVLQPEFEFIAHASPTGLIGYHADAFPGYYDSLFVTLWSSFPGAQKVVRVSPDGTLGDFSTGYTAPIDVAVGPDGNLYVADYWVGNIFQISYVGEE